MRKVHWTRFLSVRSHTYAGFFGNDILFQLDELEESDKIGDDVYEYVEEYA